jgi:hypothetical protein
MTRVKMLQVEFNEINNYIYNLNNEYLEIYI